MTSAAVAVTIVAQRAREKATLFFGAIACVFAYTTVTNVIDRPDGVKIAAFFIGVVLIVSVISRIWRTLELRVDTVELDEKAQWMVGQLALQPEVCFLANHPDEPVMTYEEFFIERQNARYGFGKGRFRCC